MRTKSILLLATSVLTTANHSVIADILTVGPGDEYDYSSIQSATVSAVSGDTVLVADGTYYENIAIGEGITLQSENGPDSCIIDGGHNGSVLTGTGISAAWLTGFTVRNGSSANGGGLRLDGSTLTITDTIITQNICSGPGGGLDIRPGSSVAMINSIVSDNSALNGGAVFVYPSASVEMFNTTISGNSASKHAGGVYSEGSASITNSIIWGNSSTFYAYPRGILSIAYSNISTVLGYRR